MKKIFTILLISSVSIVANATNKKVDSREEGTVHRLYGDLDEGIKFFQGSWADALKESGKKDKLIFLDAYAAWCGPCKMMAKQTFTDSKVGKMFNEEFINVKMDMEKNSDGPRLSKKFALTAYPSLYFVDKNEKVVHMTLGYHKPKQLIEVAKQVLAM
jgi:thiol:disulfide interchange protein